MPFAILLIVIGASLAISAYKGVSVSDVYAGVLGDSLDPHGPNIKDIGGGDLPDGGSTTDPGSSTDTSKYHFGGPNAALLGYLANAAVTRFNLTITATTNGTHVANSYHYRRRAFDAAGKPADMAAYYQWVHDNYGHTIVELFYDPKGAVKNGQDIPAIGGHSDHVHTAA